MRCPETLKSDKELHEAKNFVSWLIDVVRLRDRKLAGHQYLDAKRGTRRVLESKDRAVALLNVRETSP